MHNLDLEGMDISDVVLRTPLRVEEVVMDDCAVEHAEQKVASTPDQVEEPKNLCHLLETIRHLEEQKTRLLGQLKTLEDDLEVKRQEGKSMLAAEMELIDEQGTVLSTLYECKRLCEFVLNLSETIPDILEQCSFMRSPLIDCVKKDASDVRTVTRDARKQGWKTLKKNRYVNLQTVRADLDLLKLLSFV